MRNRPRDVTGGDEVLSQLVPGMSLMNYILGWFTVPAEVFLRFNFGERYFTRANFIAGLIVLFIFKLFSGLDEAISSLNPFPTQGPPRENASWMGFIIKWYIRIGIFHFLHIWWNDIRGKVKHSFYSGTPLLRPIGKVVMWLLNLPLAGLIRVISHIMPGDRNEFLKRSLPVLKGTDTFTERFIEPAFLLVFLLIAWITSQTAVVTWLLFTIMAHSFYTGMRHQAERSFILDLRDQMLEAKYMRQAMSGESSEGGERYKRIVREAVHEVEKSPEVLKIVEQRFPNLADAMEKLSPKLRKAAAQQEAEAQATPPHNTAQAL
jgi:hypothetical protein